MGLGDLPGDQFESLAFGLSADGTTVVGYSYGVDGIEAIRWTQAEGMIGIGDLPGGATQSVAYGVSGDGAVVSGISHTSSSFGTAGFRWSALDGMADLGNDGFASGVSQDGAGRGRSPCPVRGSSRGDVLDGTGTVLC